MAGVNLFWTLEGVLVCRIICLNFCWRKVSLHGKALGRDRHIPDLSSFHVAIGLTMGLVVSLYRLIRHCYLRLEQAWDERDIADCHLFVFPTIALLGLELGHLRTLLHQSINL